MKPMHVPTGFPASTGRNNAPPRGQRPGSGARHIDYRRFLDCLNLVGQTEMAKILGLNESQIYNYASGNGKPRPELVAKLRADPRFDKVFNESTPMQVPAGLIARGNLGLEPQNGAPSALPVEVPAKASASPAVPPDVVVNTKPKKGKKAKVVAVPASPAASAPDMSITSQEQEITPWPGRSLCVIEPFYQGVHEKCHLAMKDWYDPTTMRTAQKSQESFLLRTRNRLAAMFLKTDCQWSLWIDSDIITPCRPEVYRAVVDKATADRVHENFLRVPMPTRLVNWGKTVVSGVYFDRHGKGSIMAKLRTRPVGKLPQNCLAAAEWVATGCVLVHRKVFEDVAAKYPETAPSENGESGFFMPWRNQEGRMLGEDEAFFTRAANAGHPSYVDLGVICGHVGEACYGLPDGY